MDSLYGSVSTWWLNLVTVKTTGNDERRGVTNWPLLNTKDTINAIEERFGRWTNVAVTIDGLSNLDPRATSDLPTWCNTSAY